MFYLLGPGGPVGLELYSGLWLSCGPPDDGGVGFPPGADGLGDEGVGAGPVEVGPLGGPPGPDIPCGGPEWGPCDPGLALAPVLGGPFWAGDGPCWPGGCEPLCPAGGGTWPGGWKICEIESSRNQDNKRFKLSLVVCIIIYHIDIYWKKILKILIRVCYWG